MKYRRESTPLSTSSLVRRDANPPWLRRPPSVKRKRLLNAEAKREVKRLLAQERKHAQDYMAWRNEAQDETKTTSALDIRSIQQQLAATPDFLLCDETLIPINTLYVQTLREDSKEEQQGMRRTVDLMLAEMPLLASHRQNVAAETQTSGSTTTTTAADTRFPLEMQTADLTFNFNDLRL